MADVSERGQLIIVLGLLVATTFVVLTLLLNTVIFTENLASRGTDVGGNDAIEYRGAVVDGVGGLIDEENGNDYTTKEPVRTNVSDGVDEIGNITTRHQIPREDVALVANTTLHNGSALRQTNGSRNMSSASGGGGILPGSPLADWTLATNISDTRKFRMNVTGGLVDPATPPTGGYVVVIEQNTTGILASADTWKVWIYEDSGDPTMAVKNGSEASGTTGVCSSMLPSDPPFTVNFTAGAVNGTDCSALRFAHEIDEPYDIKYQNADNVTGTYNVTINTTGFGTARESRFHDPGNGSPYHVRAVYSVAFDVHYETPELVYRAAVRVAPGEPE